MKTLADFKRRLKIGVKLHTIFHQSIIGRDGQGHVIYGDIDKGIREVSKVSNTNFALKTLQKDGTTYIDSYCNFPPAKDTIIRDNSITIREEDYRVRQEPRPLIPILTYTFID